MNYYELLGVAETATQEEITSAYRSLAVKYHPDKTKNDPVATQKFKEIALAYETLADFSKRARYNLTLAKPRKPPVPPKPKTQPPPSGKHYPHHDIYKKYQRKPDPNRVVDGWEEGEIDLWNMDSMGGLSTEQLWEQAGFEEYKAPKYRPTPPPRWQRESGLVDP